MKKKENCLILPILIAVVACVILAVMVWNRYQGKQEAAGGGEESVLVGSGGSVVEKVVELPSYVKQEIVPVNGVGRRGEQLEGVTDIVIHYVGNPGTTAEQNRSYYAQADTQVSSHFLIGLDGEVIQCIPLAEKSSASNDRNRDTISIEVCHPDDTGKFTDASYDRLVELTTWLCQVYGLDSSHVIRHYDVTGKECPRYFVQHEDAWEQFKLDVEEALGK